MKKFTFFLMLMLLGYVSSPGQADNENLSPRAKYIMAFDFVAGEAQEPYPRRSSLEVPPGLDGTPRISRSIYTSEDLEGFISEEVRGYRLAWNIWPYQLHDLQNQEVDVLESRECLGNAFFWPMSQNPDQSNDIWDNGGQLEELMHMRLAEQFADFVEADNALRMIIISSDHLFSAEEGKDINRVFYEAWQSGRLIRPTLMIPAGECSPGWAEYRVTVSFNSDTERLFAISAGDHRLCTLENVDPWDASQCKGGPWELVRGDIEPIGMYGRYFFKTQSSVGNEVILGPINISSDRNISL